MYRLIHTLKKEWDTFFSNVVLGFNDALIELTGALVGFSFALRDTKLIAAAGLITGLSASMSMAASAFQQARHEEGRNPLKAALFTGIAYIVVALILVSPFLLSADTTTALLIMSGCAIVLIAVLSFYSALLLGRSYVRQFGELCLFSLGVGLVSFLLGTALSAVLAS